MSHWYVLFVRGGYEHEINEFFNLEGLASFIPMKNELFLRQGKKIIVQKPLYKNYLFIESDLSQLQLSQLLKSFKQRKEGIIKLLAYEDEETPALSKEERALLERLLNKDKVLETSCGYIENDKVVITEGPLLGFESSITKIDRHKRRATLNVDICGRLTEVNVSLEILKKI